MGTGFVKLARSVGRLVECRSRGFLSLEIARELEGQLRDILGPGGPPVLMVADARNTEPFRDDIAQEIRLAIQGMNPWVERAGILVGGRPLYDVQIESILVACRHPRERTFRDVSSLIDFLSETATDDERRRMAAFFSEWTEES